jgi:hypothetical protein
VRGAICIALKGDCWHTDDRARGELSFQIVIFLPGLESGQVASDNCA